MNQIEQELLNSIANKNNNVPSMGDSALLGAGVGAAIGAFRPTSSDEIILARLQGKPTPGRGFMRRAAGGLTGAILGGMLGPGARQLAVQNNPTAGALARLQLGTATPTDMRIIEETLASNYNSVGLM